ncbi:MAG: hypothetical protein H7Y36_00700, partial [Armatimonadetes bacterium]|nr:hypothetical protein [Akkermansiaceae bacterium]
SLEHDYPNAFEGMRLEMTEAEDSVLHHKPIHWKEVIDDLIYTLNFHAELMPAEDHLVLKSLVMPFLMNVIAAMPLDSGNQLLALYDAGKLEIVSGKVTIAEAQETPGMTTINLIDDDAGSSVSYRMFIDCSGQKALELENYPFPGLITHGAVRKARAHFHNSAGAANSLTDAQQEHLFFDEGEPLYHIGGIDIDGTFRLIGADGKPNRRIHDIAFPHTSGVRPYSYGLQACSDTGAIVVKAWIEEIKTGAPLDSDPDEITQIYEKV